VQWTLWPAQPIDHRKDVDLIDARHWPTALSLEHWRRVTGTGEFAGFLSGCLNNGSLDYYCNNFVSYALRGVHIHMNVLWDFEGPPSSDTYFSSFRGTNSRVEVRQGAPEDFRPEVYIVPNTGALARDVSDALRRKIDARQPNLDGVTVESRGDEFRLNIPHRHRVGHEAHFAQVTRRFFDFLKNPQALPGWEKANMLAKYYVTTAGVELAMSRAERS
jgi:hypothetical protein